MLRVAGRMASGTVTWMTGPGTIESHIIPTIREAAIEAGRSEPRIGVGLPVCVTDDTTAAREKAAEEFVIYGQLPSYRAMLDREGAAGPADVAIVGTESRGAGPDPSSGRDRNDRLLRCAVRLGRSDQGDDRRARGQRGRLSPRAPTYG